MLGLVSGEPAQLHLLTHKAALNEALRGLEAEGVIKKVATRKWAAPIVTPVKKDGGVRVCGDIKVTIIPPFGNQ